MNDDIGLCLGDDRGKARLLQLDVVIGRQSVNALHDMTVGQQAAREMEADKAGGAGDEKSHGKNRSPLRLPYSVFFHAAPHRAESGSAGAASRMRSCTRSCPCQRSMERQP